MQNLNSKFKVDIKQRTYQFSLSIINLTNELPKTRAAWVITDQVIRSSTSIGANLVEARASSSRLEFKKFYEISLKSANETIYWLNLLRDSRICNDKEIDVLIKEATEISNILGKSVISLKKK
ncbi:MAG: hypothetical protein QG585_636 [Patescibacteria group bacterium]|jgi:four helix bundle protein|nr:hypothetical protein [Patescibacteria group bacterium]